MFWLNVALLVVAALLLAPLAVVLYSRWLHRSFFEPDASDEVHYVKTEDGARLALYRYRARGETKRSEPVFFAHGLGASKYNLDFDDTYSWVRKFADQGFDAWVVDWRGAGASTSPKKWNWNFDHYARHDVGACLAHIRRVTGAEKVHWVGHSMGGMLLYAFLGSGERQWIRSGLTMGSPVRFKDKRGLKGAVSLAWLLDYMPYVPVRALTHLSIPFVTWFPNNAIARSQMNVKNVDMKFIKRIAYNAVFNLSVPLLKQFSDWVEHDCFRSYDKAIDYQAAVAKITVPIFMIAGAGDVLVMPENVRKAYDTLPEGTGSKFLVVGKQTGFCADYGHIDLVFGTRANDEVLPLALEWVISHDTLRDPVSV